MLDELNECANKLDSLGLYKEADLITGVMLRVSSSREAGFFNRSPRSEMRPEEASIWNDPEALKKRMGEMITYDTDGTATNDAMRLQRRLVELQTGEKTPKRNFFDMFVPEEDSTGFASSDDSGEQNLAWDGLQYNWQR